MMLELRSRLTRSLPRLPAAASAQQNIQNDAKINEDLDQRALLRKYEKELKRLRAELEKRSKELVDKRHLLEVEEQRKRAEQDKMAAITALEARSKQFLAEKEEKRKLEEKITSMQSQLLIGGHKIQDIPVFRQMLELEQKKIRNEYEKRLKELEEERKVVEVDRTQVSGGWGPALSACAGAGSRVSCCCC